MKKLLQKAKFGLMIKGSVFLASILFSIRHIVDDTIPTAATDGLTVLYNTKFFESLTPDERIFLVAHEIWHIALSHMIRIGDRDHGIWNMAADYVINGMLIKAGFTMPKGGLHNPKYDGWSTVRVYDYLIKRAVRVPVNFVMDVLQAGSVTPAPGQKGKPKVPPPGSVQAKAAEQVVEQKIKVAVLAAQTQSKLKGEGAGVVPGEVSRKIEQLINPVLPWDQLLNRYMDAFIKDDYSWTKPNRRFMPDHYLPSMYSEALGEITVAFDTSGSIGRDEYQPMLSEAAYIYEKYRPSKMTLLDCDYSIHNDYEMHGDDPIDIMDLEFSGGGGTRFQPVFDFCAERDTKLLLYFTDLDAKPITEEPGYPVIWLCYSDEPPAPIGETIYYEP